MDNLFSLPHIALQSELQKAIEVCLTLIVAIGLSSFLRSLIKVPKHLETRRSLTYVTVVKNTISVVIFVIAAYTVFLILGIPIEPLLTSAGIAGIAIGLGVRPLIEDLVAGVFLLSNASIAIGDYVSVTDVEGYIENIGFRVLSVRDLNGALHIIPNGQIKQVVNFYRGASNVLLDIPIDPVLSIDEGLAACKKALMSLQKDDTIGPTLRQQSSVLGVEAIAADGKVSVRVEIITNPSQRFIVARRYRYLAIKSVEEEKNKQKKPKK